VITRDEINEVLSYADSFLTDWVDNEGRGDPECLAACKLAEELGPKLVRFPDLVAALRTARDALRHVGNTYAYADQDDKVVDAEDACVAALKGVEE
jgi:hypothetical protein